MSTDQMTAPHYQLLPPLDPDQLEDLRKDIAANGVRVPIDVDENGEILDGHHRYRIAASLHVDCPRRTVPGLTEPQKREFALAVNLNRRHLTREQRRELIENSLKTDPELTDREHARRTGTSPTTVGTTRARLESEGQIEQQEVRVDPRGHKQAAPSVQLDTRKEANDASVPLVDEGDDAERDEQFDEQFDDRAAEEPPSQVASTVPPVHFQPAASGAVPTSSPAPRRDPRPPVSDEERDRVEEAEARQRRSDGLDDSLAFLFSALDPNPVKAVSGFWDGARARRRGFPHIDVIYTPKGLRTIADHLNAIADHLEETGATL